MKFLSRGLFAAVCYIVISIFSLNLTVSAFADSEENEEQITIDWVAGPADADIGNLAKLKLPEGYVFANGDDTRKIMEYYGNQITDRELGYIAPQDQSWFMVFEFEETGYIKDDEKENLDQDAILDSIKEGTKQGNEWRKQNNIPEMEVVGWHTAPFYNAKTNNLEWGIEFSSNGNQVINYNIRYLGRKGVMEVILVCNPDQLANAIEETQTLLVSYSFTKGNKYSEFVSGDKMAKYGLSALVAGGTVAAAAKSGLLQRFWKIILVAFAAVGGFIKKFFGRIFNRNKQQ